MFPFDAETSCTGGKSQWRKGEYLTTTTSSDQASKDTFSFLGMVTGSSFELVLIHREDDVLPLRGTRFLLRREEWLRWPDDDVVVWYSPFLH